MKYEYAICTASEPPQFNSPVFRPGRGGDENRARVSTYYRFSLPKIFTKEVCHVCC